MRAYRGFDDSRHETRADNRLVLKLIGGLLAAGVLGNAIGIAIHAAGF